MSTPLKTHNFTVDEYHHLGEIGILDENDRVELIDGQVVEMTPIGPRHAVCVDRLNRRLSGLVGDSAIVRVQSPVLLGARAEVEPDLALLRPPFERYREVHPRPAEIMLVIEVADTSAASDRDVKVPLYGRAGIPEVWLVDIESDTIEVYREPGPHGYTEVRTVTRTGVLTAIHLPHVVIPASEVLGKAR